MSKTDKILLATLIAAIICVGAGMTYLYFLAHDGKLLEHTQPGKGGEGGKGGASTCSGDGCVPGEDGVKGKDGNE